jgi:ferrous-iron efflux pump FieF
MATNDLSPEQVIKLKKSATGWSLTVGFTMLFIKIGAWIATGSVSVLSSVMDSLMDNVMGLVNFLSVRQGSRPADREHRFGYGKLEPLASLAQAAFMVGVAIMIMIEAVDRLSHPQPLENADLGMGAMVLVIAMIIGLVLYQQRVIRLTGSIVVRADSLHYKADVMMHGAIIISLLLTGRLGIEWADSAFAFGVALFLLWGAKGILIEALNILVDRELPEEERLRIRGIALSHPEVQDIHDLRTRSSGERVFVQLHMEMAPEIRLSRAHEAAEDVIDGILEVYPDAEVQVHEEPLGMPRHRSWCGGQGGRRRQRDADAAAEDKPA